MRLIQQIIAALLHVKAEGLRDVRTRVAPVNEPSVEISLFLSPGVCVFRRLQVFSRPSDEPHDLKH